MKRINKSFICKTDSFDQLFCSKFQIVAKSITPFFVCPCDRFYLSNNYNFMKNKSNSGLNTESKNYVGNFN